MDQITRNKKCQVTLSLDLIIQCASVRGNGTRQIFSKFAKIVHSIIFGFLMYSSQFVAQNLRLQLRNYVCKIMREFCDSQARSVP